MKVRKLSLPSGAAAWILDASAGGRRIRREYRTRDAAMQAAEDLRAECYAIGRAALSLSPRDRLDAAMAREILPAGVSMVEAATRYVAALARPRLTVGEAVAQMVRAKVEAGRRPRTVGDLSDRLGRFAEAHGDRQLADVTAADVSAFIGRWSGQTAVNYRRALGGLFAYWQRKGIVASNPALATDRPAVRRALPGIVSPSDAERLLRGTAERDRPALAVALFAGCRSGELAALRWGDVADGALVIAPDVAKTRRLRLVELVPPLSAWIEAYRPADATPDAPLAPPGWRDRLVSLAGRLAIRLPHNATRHTFASMAIARGDDPAAVSRIMGNSPAVLAGHYRNGRVTRAEAARFFAILPGAEAAKEKEKIGLEPAGGVCQGSIAAGWTGGGAVGSP